MMGREVLSKVAGFFASFRGNLIAILRLKRFRRLGLLASLVYLFAYLWSIQNIVYLPDFDLTHVAPIPSIALAEDWATKMWKSIAPFVWEPIAVIYPVNHIMVFISIPNLLIALLLSALVGLNLAVAGHRFAQCQAIGRRSGSFKGLLASVPSLLTGFTCCVPTFLIALGSLAAGLTVAVIALRPLFVPAAALALGLNLIWGTWQVSCRVDDQRITHLDLQKERV